ncbi:MAG: valine--tRNA ligase [Nitrospiria bacterium]
MSKVYDPKTVEAGWGQVWLDGGYFHASMDSQQPSYCIVIPPPNITGSLHLGHALNTTLQDILVRWKRMQGHNVLWVPGTDHAGIATQNVVERQLKAEGLNREVLGREKFIERVWKWREQFGGIIIEQLKRLGASCDWSRERFTLDEGLSVAVREVFVRLYEEGLIYRGERLINWCSRCRTALSDIEVEYEEIQGKMYYIKYPLADEPEKFLTVATTRPETLLGDTGVAVHPEDPRYNKLIGQQVRLPLTHRKIPIVGDSILVEREFGTGAVKVTPAHDFNDFEAGVRHGLARLSILDEKARILPSLDQEGVDKEVLNDIVLLEVPKARARVVDWLHQRGLLVKIEDHRHAIGRCYRCKSVVEPYLSPQWFVKIKPLAVPAIEAVKSGRIRFIPTSWENSYFSWMENIKDWCISRQIWWGHQIPAWYCIKCNADQLGGTKDITKPRPATLTEQSREPRKAEGEKGSWPWILPSAKPIVDRERPHRCPDCGGNSFIQDPDVLDTWFSSALWPFSTLGWPRDTPELKFFYPTNVLLTSFDILFFWVARMIMMGLHFIKEVPFRDVYIHALVRDAEGQKMSKSKGNVIDPLGVMDQYGTDALRFTLAAMASPGRDIKLSEQRIEGYRNFANKLWNASRFVLMNIEGKSFDWTAPHRSLADQWIGVRLQRCIKSVASNLEEYRFDEAANHLYQFIWHEYCDWYLELIKPRLAGESPEADAAAARATMVNTLESLLRLLHPFMPFITEEIWQKLPHTGDSIVVAPYPTYIAPSIEDQAVEGMMDAIIRVITEIRTIRSELNIPPAQRLKAGLRTTTVEYAHLILRHGEADIKRLAGLSEFTTGLSISVPPGAMVTKTQAGEVFVVIEGVDLRKEQNRLEKKLAAVNAELARVNEKWNSLEFQQKAPAEVIANIDRRRNELNEQLFTISEHLRRIARLLEEHPS